MGVGGMLGSLAAFALIGRKRLASDFGLGIVLWGAPLAAIGIWPHLWVALVALAVLGLGNTLVDVAGLTLLQRTAPPDVIGRVFGVLEMILVATIGLGAALAPALIDLVGTRWSLVVTGAFLPVLAALTWRQLRRDRRRVTRCPPSSTCSRAVPIFSSAAGARARAPRLAARARHGAGRAPRSSGRAITATASTSSSRAACA